MKTTTLLSVVRPSKTERKKTEADYIFLREDLRTGRKYKIYVKVSTTASEPSSYYRWSQWGCATDILSENVDNIERFFSTHDAREEDIK